MLRFCLQIAMRLKLLHGAVAFEGTEMCLPEWWETDLEMSSMGVERESWTISFYSHERHGESPSKSTGDIQGLGKEEVPVVHWCSGGSDRLLPPSPPAMASTAEMCHQAR